MSYKTISKTENGRSFVELIGVLAIIGVLSIASLEMYDFLSAKNTTSKIVSTVLQAKILAKQDTRQKHASEVNRYVKSQISEFAPRGGGAMVLAQTSGDYYVNLYGVSPRVCTMVKGEEDILNAEPHRITLTQTCFCPKEEDPTEMEICNCQAKNVSYCQFQFQFTIPGLYVPTTKVR